MASMASGTDLAQEDNGAESDENREDLGVDIERQQENAAVGMKRHEPTTPPTFGVNAAGEPFT